MSRVTWQVVLILVLCGAAARAQDSVRLAVGGFVRGEVLEETDAKVVMITLLGELRSFPRAEVTKVRRGGRIKSRVQARLDRIDAKDAGQVFEVAAWAAETKGLEADGARLARRVLVLDPAHAGARKLAGHVKALDVWYEDAEKARAAVEKEMTAKGFAYVNGGWAPAEKVADVKAKPAEWLLIDDFYWRPLREVMLERGFVEWRGEWYPGEDADLVRDLMKVAERTGEDLHAARKGLCVVYSCNGRQSAQDLVDRQDRVRNWFLETFEVPKGRVPATGPVSRVYLFGDLAGVGSFGATYFKELGVTRENMDFALRQEHIPFKDLGHATSLGHPVWENALVSQLGGDLLKHYHHFGYELPAWLWVAAAHTAEIVEFGEARVQYVSPDVYGRQSEVPVTKGLGIKGFKDLVRDLYKEKKAVDLRLLFHRVFNELTADMNLEGVVLLQFFLEQKKPEFLGFLVGPDSAVMTQRFEKYFKANFDQVEHDFKEWLKKD